MFLFGTLFYGKVDSVPGLFFIATRFFHIFCFPLIPFQSCLVYDGVTEQKWEGGYLNKERFTTPALRVPFNLKSVVVAWLRAFLILVLLGSVPVTFFGSSEWTTIYVGSALIAAVLLHLSYVFTRATRTKALQLGQLAKVPEDMVLRACNSVSPPFGVRFGRRIYWICERCGAISGTEKLRCSMCGANQKPRELTRDMVSVVVFLTLAIALGLWMLKMKYFR